MIAPDRVAAVLLAAGSSTRLGTFKPLLPWPAEDSDEMLVEYQVRQLLHAGLSDVIVVVGDRADQVEPAARRWGARVVFNEDFASGKASSVRTGLAAAPLSWLLVVGVDQPRPASFYHTLCAAAQDSAPVVVPAFQGERGHPPLFHPRLRDELLAVSEQSEGMRSVVHAHLLDLQLVECGELARININRPEDVARARALVDW
ncbi:MAG: nucleotidyltransferase family protein [Chloroflexi bacterium]|nr:nucleotidyltransferase family protein [Chloroflexota bacterium]